MLDLVHIAKLQKLAVHRRSSRQTLHIAFLDTTSVTLFQGEFSKVPLRQSFKTRFKTYLLLKVASTSQVTTAQRQSFVIMTVSITFTTTNIAFSFGDSEFLT